MAVQAFQIGVKALIRNSEGQILMVHLPAWSGNEPHWDFPGGRIDPGEDLISTLRRELKEEIGVVYLDNPKQVMAFITNITIPEGKVRLPLLYVVYEVKLHKTAQVKLDPKSAEDDFGWFDPSDAIEKMNYKFPPKFIEYIKTTYD